MKKLDLVLINMSCFSDWQQGTSNRNFHIFQELERSTDINHIMCVDYPPLKLKRVFRNYKDSVLTKLDGAKTIYHHPFGKVSKLSDRVFVYSFVDFYWQPKKFVERLRHYLTELGFTDYLCWSFFPPLTEQLDQLKSQLYIFDAVDNWADHSSYKKERPRLLRNYELIKNKADIIFTVAEELQKLFGNQSNVYWIPNGVDLKHYQRDIKLVNRDIADLPRPVIGYIGVIQDRVDLDLIKYLAQEHPKKSFVLIGPTWYEAEIKELEKLPNIHLLGYKSYEEAPMYIQQFDVGLIPHKQSAFVTSTNPMKMFEYLACGKPVVATAKSGAEMFQDYVYLANDQASFSRLIDQALTDHSQAKEQERKSLMEAYSWTKTVKEMLKIISVHQ